MKNLFLRHLTLYQIQDERSGLWYHASTKTWVKQDKASIWTTHADLVLTLGDIRFINGWCDKEEHKRIAKSRSFNVTVKVPVVESPDTSAS